jgi:hypothetical protein
MKVVINISEKWFFSLSALALKELAKRNAKCLTVLTPQIYYGGYKEPYKDGWEKDFEEDKANFDDIGDGMSINSNGYILKDGLIYMLEGHNDCSDRIDKDLVDVVETMGKKSHGVDSKLKVVEIPDGIEWEILNFGFTEVVYEVGHCWG